jgi:hypothetical protein
MKMDCSTSFRLVRKEEYFIDTLCTKFLNGVLSLINLFSGIRGTSRDSLSVPNQFIPESFRAHWSTLLVISRCLSGLCDNFICSFYVS